MKANALIFKLIKILLTVLMISCKNETKQTEIITILPKETITKTNGSSETILNSVLNKNLISIINQDNEFKISCATKSNIVKCEKKTLYLEIVEPINYGIKKIEESNTGFKIYFIHENFFYDVSLVDKSRGILYWKNLTLNNKKIDHDYSFYTIDENILQNIHLKNEDCGENKKILDKSTWKVTCQSSENNYFTYSEDTNEGSLSGILKKEYFFSITCDLNKKDDSYELRYSQNYSSSSESEDEQFWNNFSKTEIIANIKVINHTEIEFIWLGFYNIKTRERESS